MARYVLLMLGLIGIAFAAPEKPATMPTKRPPDHEVGKRLYKQSCWQCHGEEGEGDGPAASALADGVASLKGRIKEDEFDTLIDAIQRGQGRMPAYAEDIDRHDSRRILLYLRDVFEGTPVPPPPEKPPADEPPGGEGQ